MKTRTIASWAPAALANRCIVAKLNTRTGALALSDSRLVGEHADPLERISLDKLIGHCIFGHRREGAQDRGGSACGPALDAEEMLDECQGLGPAEFGQGPLGQGPTLYLHVENPAHAMLVGGIGARGARAVFEPGRKVLAERPCLGGKP